MTNLNEIENLSESITVIIDEEEIKIDIWDIENADYVGQLLPEFRIYSDGRFTIESALKDGDGCVWNARADDDTFSALGYERILDVDGHETYDLKFVGTFDNVEYLLNNWINNQ